MVLARVSGASLRGEFSLSGERDVYSGREEFGRLPNNMSEFLVSTMRHEGPKLAQRAATTAPGSSSFINIALKAR